MLNYTCHPWFDVGLATITAFAEKLRPEKLADCAYLIVSSRRLVNRVAFYVSRYPNVPPPRLLTDQPAPNFPSK